MFKLFFVEIEEWPDKAVLYQKAEALGALFLKQTIQYQKVEDAALTLAGKLLLKEALRQHFPETNLNDMQWDLKEKPFFPMALFSIFLIPVKLLCFPLEICIAVWM